MNILLLNEQPYFIAPLLKFFPGRYTSLICAQNTTEAISEIKTGRRYDIIISDIALSDNSDPSLELLKHNKTFPGINLGDDLAQTAGLIIWDKYTKQYMPNTPTLFFTACSIGHDQVQELGINYLQKVQTVERLLEEITLLTSRRTT